MSAYLTPNSSCKIRLEKIGAEMSEIQHLRLLKYVFHYAIGALNDP